MPKGKRKEEAPEQGALYQASARDTLLSCAAALHRLACEALTAGEVDVSGKTFVAESMVRNMTRAFGLETADTVPPPAEKKKRGPKKKLAPASNQLDMAEANGARAREEDDDGDGLASALSQE